MEVKNLLSVVIAALTALGAMLFAMGSQSPWLAMALWMAAVVSLVVTDFLGVVRIPRKAAIWLLWGVQAIFSPYLLVQSGWDGRMQTAANILIYSQLILLFQEKDARTYGWLAVMSLLQAVVAARYSQGVAFGGLIITYTIVGIFALSLLVLYSQWGRHRGQSRVGAAVGVPPGHHVGTPTTRWPLAAMQAKFTSAPAGSGRSGVVTELFARLALIAAGALFLAAIIFSTVPRPPAAWRGETRKPLNTVGFSDQITLGGLGDTIENRQEVMQLKLMDPATSEVYPMRDDVYLRGSVVTWYSQNQWRREPPPNQSPVGNALRGVPGVPDERPLSPSWNATEGVPYRRGTRRGIAQNSNSVDDDAGDPALFRIGPPVVQKITMEPYLAHNDIFYIWPLVEPVGDKTSPPLELVGNNALYDPSTGRLGWKPTFSGDPRGSNSKCEVRTSGLVDGHQAPLIPASRVVRVSPYLQMPSDRWPLPRLTALAARWLKESGLPLRKHYDVARWFEKQFSASGQFHYSLQGEDRDTSMDSIEDFVSNHPRGHCEYFATALALMLRSQGIPARVVLGYHCDEWHEDQQCYQVRQLHAHAWVEAFLSEDQIAQVPKEVRRSDRKDLRPDEEVDWRYGGWLRLDPTPAAEVGTRAADRTMWGAWQGRWHGLQRYWDKYVVDMDRLKQRESVYEPISRATRKVTSKLLNPHWWRELAASLWASLAAKLRSGIMGGVFGVVVLIAIVIVPVTVGWWIVRGLRWLWRRFAAAGGRRQAGARSSIEFYRRFEQIAARLGLQRRAGQTPREFACAAGTRLAAVSGRRELFAWAVQVAEAFYTVRFGRQALDGAAAQKVAKALEELTAGVAKPPPK